MFSKKREIWESRDALVVSGLGDYSLADTLECGQAFRYELIERREGWAEYMTVVGEELIFVGQRQAGELVFFDISDEVFERVAVPYFALEVDYGAIREDVTKRCKSEWLARAAHSARGVVILKQDEWEAYMSVFQQADAGASSAEKWQLMDRMFHLYE